MKWARNYLCSFTCLWNNTKEKQVSPSFRRGNCSFDSIFSLLESLPFGECTIICDLYFQLSLVCMSVAFSLVKYGGISIILLFQPHIWPWISGKLKKKGKTDEFCSFNSISIVLSINILHPGKSKMRSWRQTKGLVGMGQVNLMDFVKSLAYPHLNKKAEGMDGNYAIHLTFSCVAFFPFSAFHGV